MHSAGSFLLRLPSPSAGGTEETAWCDVEPGKMHGVFPESTWRMLERSKIYNSTLRDKKCAPPQSRYHGGADVPTFRSSGSGVDIIRALQAARPRQWCVTLRVPEEEGTLAAIDWMHKRATELSYGGVVEPNGWWCLYVVGKCSDPEAVDWGSPAVLNDAAVSEHLRIAVAEGSTMLTQMLIEQKW